MATTTRTITIPRQLDPVTVLGPIDEVLREVERAFPDLTIIVRGDRIAIMSRSKQSEAQAAQAEDVLADIIQAAYTAPMDADTVRRMLDQNVLKNSVRQSHPGHGRVVEELRLQKHAQGAAIARDETADRRKPHVPGVITFALGKPVRAKTAGQIAYVNAIESHTITFAIGPAGTGKTYLAVAKAVRAFQDRQVRRIILTRPAVEAGENLGFLPGTLNEKVDPYLRPLYDALSDMLGADQLKRYMDDGAIEVAPLAYMRGRTLNDAFVILDEAQNTTEQQMKMFLTRLGFQHQDDHHRRRDAGRSDRAQVGTRHHRTHPGRHRRHRFRPPSAGRCGKACLGRQNRRGLRPACGHRRRSQQTGTQARQRDRNNRKERTRR